MITKQFFILRWTEHSRVKELNELLDSGMLSPSEYEELVGDFKDIESIREDISDEKNKILAAKIVEAISVLIKVI